MSQRRVGAGFSPAQDACSTTRTTGSTTSTRTAARSAASGPGSRTSTRSRPGLQKSDLVVLAARPSVGKTSFALNIAEHAAVTGPQERGRVQPRDEQGAARAAAALARSPTSTRQRLRTGFLEELDFARIAPAMNALSEAPIYIDDTPNITTMELRTKARRLQAESGLDLVIVDYLQLMQSSTTTRDANRVQEVSRDLARPQGARPRAQGPGRSPSRSCPASPRCGSRRSRGCRTSASRARSSRTRTS